MADIAKSGNASIASTLIPHNDMITGLYVAEDIKGGDACYVGSDGLIHKSDGAQSDGVKQYIDGYAAGPAWVAQNGPATLYRYGVWGGWGNSLTPGTYVYLSAATKGGLATTTSTNVTTPCGKVLDTGRIELWPTHP